MSDEWHKIQWGWVGRVWRKSVPTVKSISIVVVGVGISIVIFAFLSGIFFPDEPVIPASEQLSGDSDTSANEDCTVVGINLHGTLLTYLPYHSENDPYFDYDLVSSEDVTSTIEQANDESAIKAIMIEVDSGGGSPVAGEEIANAVKNSSKPVAVFIRGMGASSAYWAASSADRIFASKNSDVGSIGVTSSFISNVTKNSKEGYTYEQLTAGKFKDAGSPDRPLTSEERALFLRDINIVYENFIKAVAENRGLSVEKVRSFADGSTVLGEKAKSLGLIDEIGGRSEVEKYLEEKIGEKPEVCWD